MFCNAFLFTVAVAVSELGLQNKQLFNFLLNLDFVREALPSKVVGAIRETPVVPVDSESPVLEDEHGREYIFFFFFFFFYYRTHPHQEKS